MDLYNLTTHQKEDKIFISYYGLPEPNRMNYYFGRDQSATKQFDEDYDKYLASKITVPLKEEYNDQFEALLFNTFDRGSVHESAVEFVFNEKFRKGISIESIKSRIKIVELCQEEAHNKLNDYVLTHKSIQVGELTINQPCTCKRFQYAILTPIAVEEERETQENLFGGKEILWTAVKDKMPTQEDMEVIGYSPEWVDLDFNPKGTRVCFQNGDGTFTSAKWIDYQDCYATDTETMPTYWKPLYNPPIL